MMAGFPGAFLFLPATKQIENLLGITVDCGMLIEFFPEFTGLNRLQAKLAQRKPDAHQHHQSAGYPVSQPNTAAFSQRTAQRFAAMGVYL